MIILYLGFPLAWEKGLLIATGLGLVAFGYRMRTPGSAAVEKKPDTNFIDYRRPIEPAPVVPPITDAQIDNPPADTGTIS